MGYLGRYRILVVCARTGSPLFFMPYPEPAQSRNSRNEFSPIPPFNRAHTAGQLDHAKHAQAEDWGVGDPAADHDVHNYGPSQAPLGRYAHGPLGPQMGSSRRFPSPSLQPKPEAQGSLTRKSGMSSVMHLRACNPGFRV